MSARLRTSIPHPRLAPYERAVASTRIDAIELYAWNRSISLALFDEIATLEVAMRSAMATELVATFGLRWFADDGLFDDDAEAAIMQAWRQGGLAALERKGADPEMIHGKLVASFMFGFWVKLLGKGEFSRKNEPLRRRRIYDTTLWKPCLCRAFRMLTIWPELRFRQPPSKSSRSAIALPITSMSSGAYRLRTGKTPMARRSAWMSARRTR